MRFFSSLITFALLVVLSGCGPEIEDLKADVADEAVVLRGRVADGPVGPSVRVSGWAGEEHVVAEVDSEGTFTARIPLHRLPPGPLSLDVTAKETSHTSDVLASAKVEVTVPAHDAIGVVGCGGGDGPSAPSDGPLSAAATVQVKSSALAAEPIMCRVDGAGQVVLSIRAKKGAKLRAGEEEATVDDGGKAELAVSVLPWLATIPLKGLAVKLDPETGATTWVSAAAAAVKPLEVAIAVGDAQRAATLTIGADLGEPVDPSDATAVGQRMRALLSLARIFFAATQAGKVQGGEVAPETAALFLPAQQPDLKPPMIGTNIFYFGDAITLGQIAHFGSATEGETTKIADCGPYREVETGLGEPGSPLTIGRVRLDMKVAAWTRDGKPLADGVVEGGTGCPAFTAIKELEPTKDYRDGPATHAIGAWVLKQPNPEG
jgi:hypothetical protein